MLAAGDRLSKFLASPGVAADGLPGRRGYLDDGGEAVPSTSAGGGDVSRRRCIVVFGATGDTGLALVPKALEMGYHVRVFVRSRSKLSNELGDVAFHPQLEVVEGDLADLEAVEEAVHGADVVISVAGAKPETAPGPMTTAVPAMVAGCRKHGVRRLIVQACALCSVPGERWGWFTSGRLTRAVVRWQLGSNVVDDNERVIQYLHREVRDLDWTVTRPTFFEDGENKGSLAPNLDPCAPGAVSHADVASWTLAQVDSDAYIGKMPRLCYPPVMHPI